MFQFQLSRCCVLWVVFIISNSCSFPVLLGDYHMHLAVVGS
uniref:Uncharacterized protein n=1 Tax=Arundo donax TaxID=35708 RepID=A0A0A8ZMQ1_ARUDO